MCAQADGDDDMYGEVQDDDDPFFARDEQDDPFADPFFNTVRRPCTTSCPHAVIGSPAATGPWDLGVTVVHAFSDVCVAGLPPQEDGGEPGSGDEADGAAKGKGKKGGEAKAKAKGSKKGGKVRSGAGSPSAGSRASLRQAALQPLSLLAGAIRPPGRLQAKPLPPRRFGWHPSSRLALCLSVGTQDARALDERSAADLELLLMDDAAIRDAARGVKGKLLPAGATEEDARAAGRKLTKKVCSGAFASFVCLVATPQLRRQACALRRSRAAPATVAPAAQRVPPCLELLHARPQEKRELKKKAKAKARTGSDDEDAQGGEEAPGFTPALDDPRFAQLFGSPEFALDPTDPRFKKMEGRERLLTEQAKRRPTAGDAGGKAGAGAGGKQAEKGSGEGGDAAPSGSGSAAELRSMVAKLKRKAEATGSAGAKGGAGAKRTRF
jgi:hypothetical protein